MLAPLSWLQEYVSIKATPEKIAEKLLLSGTKVEEIKKTDNEVVFDLEITPNRPDTLSIIGVARELAAIFNTDLNLPETETIFSPEKKHDRVDLKIFNKKLIPNFSLAKLSNVEIGPSPNWLRKYLKLSGIRALNNVVDITNFVMLETGQPMHAFDASKIKGSLKVRGAKKTEKVTTLDSVERVLTEGTIVIEDDEKLVDLAGLMGGENSEIDEKTNEIILLVPLYDPIQIRKTSLFTNLRTEASNRFEKKLDPNGHIFALNRAIKLLAEISGARLASRITSTAKIEEKTITLETNWLTSVLGLDIAETTIFEHLSAVGFKVRKSYADEFEVQVPTFRTDINIPEDVVEEIARLYGYNNLPKTLPIGDLVPEPTQTADVALRQYLLRNTLNESTGYTLVSEDEIRTFGFDPSQTLKVINPASSDFEYLRPSLLINLVKAISANNRRNDIGFFELAKVYQKQIEPQTKLPKQPEKLAFATNRGLLAAKGVLNELLAIYKLNLKEIKSSNTDLFNEALELKSGEKTVGFFGQIKQEILNKLNINVPVFATEIDLNIFQQPEIDYRPVPKFPSVIEDFSFYLAEKYLLGDLVRDLKSKDLVSSVTVIDIFGTKEGRSVTIQVEFNDPEKTLTSAQVTPLRNKIVSFLKKNYLIKLRKE